MLVALYADNGNSKGEAGLVASMRCTALIEPVLAAQQSCQLSGPLRY
jgi:hypothetical protein